MMKTGAAMTAFAVVAIALVAGSAMAAQDCSITINGKTTQVMEPTPIVMDGQVTWGLRALSDATDSDIYMDSSGVFGLIHGDDVLLLHPESKEGVFNDKPITFSVAPFTFNGSLFVPMDDVIKTFGGTMTCNAPTSQISITMNEPAATLTGMNNPAAPANPAAANDPADPPDPPRGGARMGGGFRGGGVRMGGGIRGGGIRGGGFRGGGFRGGGRVVTNTGFRQMAGGGYRAGGFSGRDYGRYRGGDGYRYYGHGDNDFWPFALGLGAGALYGGYGYGYPAYGYPYAYPYSSNPYYCDAYGNCYYYVYP